VNKRACLYNFQQLQISENPLSPASISMPA
jgi:hypothetical protein